MTNGFNCIILADSAWTGSLERQGSVGVVLKIRLSALEVQDGSRLAG